MLIRYSGNHRSLVGNRLSRWSRLNSSLPVALLQASLPDEAYINPKYYDIERKHLLGTSWQLLTHESMLLNGNGSKTSSATYVAALVAGWPAIAVRSSKTGDIYAYHNVCRHRAGPLEWNDTSGSCKLHGLKCKYHGWTYTLNGQLRGVPGFNAVSNIDDNNVSEDLDKERYSLWSMRVANWRGLIFVQPNPEGPTAMYGSEALELFIKENKRFCDRLSGCSQDGKNSRSVNGDDNHNDDVIKKTASGIALEDFTYYSSSTHKLNCNWKIYVENYLEPYHIPTIHPGLSKQVDMINYAVHVDVGFVEHMVPTTSSSYDGVWIWHSPTLAINCYAGGLSLERIVPTGPDTTEIHYMFLFNKHHHHQEQEQEHDSSDTSRLAAIRTTTEVTSEDIQVCEAVQLGMKGGRYSSPGMLSPRYEQGVMYFQGLIRDVYSTYA